MSAGVEAAIADYGDAALLVTFAGGDAEARWMAAQGLAGALCDDPPVGFVDVVATFHTAYVAFDPLRTTRDALAAALRTRAGGDVLVPARAPREIEIPVIYDGPDLEEAAAELGLDVEELVRRHTAQPWTIRFLAAPVGAPMMDGPGFPRSVPRRRHPRTRVPAGSVAISGHQSVIYPVQAPGGWQLIGRTPLRLVDPCRHPMTLHHPGDRVRFVA